MYYCRRMTYLYKTWVKVQGWICQNICKMQLVLISVQQNEDDNESSVYYICYAIQDNVHYKIKDWFNNN